MRPKSIKFTAVLIAAFVLLNAGGSLCLAYCKTPVSQTRESSMSMAGHCDKMRPAADDPKGMSVSTNDIDCCTLTVGFVAAPIGVKQALFVPLATAAFPRIAPLSTPVGLAKQHQNLIFTYRGPPPDGRLDRIRNCIIRI